MTSKRRVLNVVLGVLLAVSLGFAFIQLQQLNTAKQALSALQMEYDSSKSDLDASKAKLTEVQASLEQAKAKQAETLPTANKENLNKDLIVTADEQAQFNKAGKTTGSNTNKGGTTKTSGNNNTTTKPAPTNGGNSKSEGSFSDADLDNWGKDNGKTQAEIDQINENASKPYAPVQ